MPCSSFYEDMKKDNIPLCYIHQITMNLPGYVHMRVRQLTVPHEVCVKTRESKLGLIIQSGLDAHICTIIDFVGSGCVPL